MKEIAPGIFQNLALYNLYGGGADETDGLDASHSVYSSDLAALRAFAKLRRYENPCITHRTSGETLPLVQEDQVAVEFLQSGSGIWYYPGVEIRRVFESGVQHFCYVDLIWSSYNSDHPSHLLELEFQEVSLEFLFSKDIEPPHYAAENYCITAAKSLT